MVKNKGFILIMVIILLMVLSIVAIGMSTYLFYTIRDTNQEVRAARDYYFSLAGLRYADIVARNPTAYGINPNAPYTIRGTELGGNLATDLGTTVTTNAAQPDDTLLTTIAPRAGAPGLFDGNSNHKI